MSEFNLLIVKFPSVCYTYFIVTMTYFSHCLWSIFDTLGGTLHVNYISPKSFALYLDFTA